jgi:hypothetical protein
MKRIGYHERTSTDFPLNIQVAFTTLKYMNKTRGPTNWTMHFQQNFGIWRTLLHVTFRNQRHLFRGCYPGVLLCFWLNLKELWPFPVNLRTWTHVWAGQTRHCLLLIISWYTGVWMPNCRTVSVERGVCEETKQLITQTVHNPSWETDSHSDDQENPTLYGTV